MKVGTLLASILVLLLGAINTICQSSAKYLRGTDLNGKRSLWAHAFSWNVIMFPAMTCAAIPWFFQTRKARVQNLLPGDGAEGTVRNETGQISIKKLEVKSSYTPWYVFIVPGCTDLVASGLTALSFRILHSAVLAQVAGNSILIWTALGSRIFLKRRLWSHHIIGIVLCLTALAIVTVADYLNDGGDSGAQDTFLTIVGGLSAQIMAQIIYATGFLFEETALQAYSATPMQVVTMEGLFGCIGTALIITPLMYLLPGSDDTCNYCQENVVNSIYQLFQRGSGAIWIPVGTFFFSDIMYNIFGQTVTQSLSATHRTLLEALRPCVVLVFQVILHALPIRTEDGVRFGEALSYWTILEVFGLCVMMVAILIYNEVILIPKTELHRMKTSSEGTELLKANE